MTCFHAFLAGILLVLSPGAARAENLLRNSGFEERDKAAPELPAYWTERHHQSSPLSFAAEHYEGKAAGLIVGDGRMYLWRQNVMSPAVKAFTLSGFVKADDVAMDRDGYAHLYGHILYKGQPYESATHFFAKIPPGTYDWKRIAVTGAAVKEYAIEMVQVSVTGRLKSGRLYVDKVELTENRDLSPEGTLALKIDDLLRQFDRVGAVDASIGQARQLLEAARASLRASPPDLTAAECKWIDAARAVSPRTWAAMFPEAMSDKDVEAQMLCHGVAQTRADCDQRLNLIESMGCNGVLESLGSWMSVIYHSNVVPVEPGWDKFDALSYFIDAAHARGIRVFGYLAALYGTGEPVARPGNIAHDHPDWLAKGPDPNMPRFPDPANPQVADYVVRMYVELATRYRLDGIGLDYIRYPTENSLNYDENNRKQIRQRFGFDIREGGDLWKDPDKWALIRQYRTEKVAEVVRRVHDAVKKARPELTIIACLVSDPDEARDGYAQDWANSARWLTYAMPMNYDDTSLQQPLLVRQRDICRRHGTRYLPAIGGMPELHKSRTISEWAAHVAMQRKVGCDGMIVYRMGGLDPAVAAFFGNGPFRTKSRFPEPLKP